MNIEIMVVSSSSTSTYLGTERKGTRAANELRSRQTTKRRLGGV